MAKKKNPDSSNRPQTPEEWAKSTPHVDKATGKPSGMTEHQRALQVSKEQGRPVADIIEQKFKAYHVNKGTITSKDMPAGRTESRRQADRRRGSDGPVPTEVRTAASGAKFRAQVGAPDPSPAAREANVPVVSASERADAAEAAEKRGNSILPGQEDLAAVAKRSEDKAARATTEVSSVISGPGGRSIRKPAQESLRDPGIVTDAGPVHEGEAPKPKVDDSGVVVSGQNPQIVSDTKRNKSRLKRQRISGGSVPNSGTVNPETGKTGPNKGTRSVAVDTAKAGGTSQGWEKFAVTNVPRDAQGNLIQGTLQHGTASIQAVDQTTQEAHHVYSEMQQHMAANPRATVGNMSQSNFELYRDAETHLLTHATPVAPAAAPGATIRNDHLGKGDSVPAGSQAVRGEGGVPMTRKAVVAGDVKAQATGHKAFLEANPIPPHPGTLQQYTAAQTAAGNPGGTQFHQAGYQDALKAHRDMSALHAEIKGGGS